MNKRSNVGPSLHIQAKRAAQDDERARAMAAVDEVYDRYVAGESMQQIADSLKMRGWYLRRVMLESDETRERFAQARFDRAHNLVESALDYGRQAAAIGDAAGLRTAIDVNLKVAAKLHPTDYGDKSRLELTGKDGGPVKLLAMTDEQLLEIASRDISKGEK